MLNCWCFRVWRGLARGEWWCLHQKAGPPAGPDSGNLKPNTTPCNPPEIVGRTATISQGPSSTLPFSCFRDHNVSYHLRGWCRVDKHLQAAAYMGSEYTSEIFRVDGTKSILWRIMVNRKEERKRERERERRLAVVVPWTEIDGTPQLGY